jgi:hypothetical protein
MKTWRYVDAGIVIAVQLIPKKKLVALFVQDVP